MTAAAGLFLTFEGVEGSGKSTQVTRLSERLRRRRVRVTVTREPGGTDLGRQLRSLLLRPTEAPMSPLAELLLYAADRAQHLHEIVEPALARGDVVLCDRYLDATLAYQGYGRGLDLDAIHELHRFPPLDRRPSRTLLLDLDESVGLERALSRDRRRAASQREGRFELELLEFHKRVRRGYLELARACPERIRIVDGSGDAGQVGDRIWDALADLLPEKIASVEDR